MENKNPPSRIPLAIIGILVLIIMFWAAISNLGNSPTSTTSTQPKTATSTPTSSALAVPAVDPANPFSGQLTTIIGADKATIQKMFSKWEYKASYAQNVDPAALKYIGQGIMLIVYFNDVGKAEGVSFLSNPPNMGDAVTGAGSYVHQHYDQLVQWANGNQKNAAKPNVTTQYPVEIHVGECHE